MDHPDRNSSKLSVYGQWLGLAIFTFYVLTVFVPWAPRSWRPPCNNSWALILHDAFVKNAAFGSDVVFTFGPYGFIYFGSTPQTYFLTLAGWLVLSLGFVFAVWEIVNFSQKPVWVKTSLAIIVAAVTASVDVVDAQIYVFIAFTFFAWIVKKPEDIRSNVVVGMALALASLVKFSWMVAILPMVGVLSITGVSRGVRGVQIGLVYAISCVLLWLLGGQPLTSFVGYLTVSLDIAGGYSSAMQLGHSWGMSNVWWFLALAAGVIITLLASLRRIPILVFVLYAVTLSFLFFVTFKAGFVRHDHHEVVAFAVLAGISILSFLVSSARLLSYFSAILITVCLAFCSVVFRLHMANPSFEPRLGKTIGFGGVADFSRFMMGRIDPRLVYEDDMRQIAGGKRLELPKGTLDVYPWGGIDLMYASGHEIGHRPVFESYTAYTSRLAGINRAFIAGVSAPDNLLFAVRAIDQRFPAMEDGLSWPEIITRYDITGVYSDYLVMQRSVNPRSYKIDQISAERLEPETAIAVPRNEAVWVRVNLPLSSQGKLLQQIYKPRVVALVVRLANGETYNFRLIPGTASAGFLISPVIANIEVFAAFKNDPKDPRLDALRPVAIGISGEPGFRGHYDFSNSTIEFSALKF